MWMYGCVYVLLYLRLPSPLPRVVCLFVPALGVCSLLLPSVRPSLGLLGTLGLSVPPPPVPPTELK